MWVWPENVKIAKASSDQRNSSDANVKTMADKQASIILEGTFNLSSGTNNLTLNVDPTSWFTGEDGTRLDPRESSARSAIENNIKRSMRVLDDDDHDGREDDHGGESGGGDSGGDDHGGN